VTFFHAQYKRNNVGAVGLRRFWPVGARRWRGGASDSGIRKGSRRRERLREKGATEREGSTRGDRVKIRILIETREG
jgi:hypothetical protein